MKKILFLFILLSLISKVYCQEYHYVPFPDSGAVWSEVYQPPTDIYGDYPKPIYERFAVNGEDTVIDKIIYNKLYLFYDSIFDKNNATFIGGIREDENKRVYFKSDRILHEVKLVNEAYLFKEIVLYDFSVGVGDTVYDGYDPSIDDWAYVIIEKIDTIKIGNTLRKVFHIKNYSWVNWIEGIGNIRGLLFSSNTLPSNGVFGDLICFFNDNSIHYYNNDLFNYFKGCFPTFTDISEKKQNNFLIDLFPNPANNQGITFNFMENRITDIKIKDCKGNTCSELRIQGQPSVELSLEKYQPGIYFYMATNKNGMVHTGKFVVQ